jgi:hypothetical protein
MRSACARSIPSISGLATLILLRFVSRFYAGRRLLGGGRVVLLGHARSGVFT